MLNLFVNKKIISNKCDVETFLELERHYLPVQVESIWALPVFTKNKLSSDKISQLLLDIENDDPIVLDRLFYTYGAGELIYSPIVHLLCQKSFIESSDFLTQFLNLIKRNTSLQKKLATKISVGNGDVINPLYYLFKYSTFTCAHIKLLLDIIQESLEFREGMTFMNCFDNQKVSALFLLFSNPNSFLQMAQSEEEELDSDVSIEETGQHARDALELVRAFFGDIDKYERFPEIVFSLTELNTFGIITVSPLFYLIKSKSLYQNLLFDLLEDQLVINSLCEKNKWQSNEENSLFELVFLNIDYDLDGHELNFEYLWDVFKMKLVFFEEIIKLLSQYLDQALLVVEIDEDDSILENLHYLKLSAVARLYIPIFESSASEKNIAVELFNLFQYISELDISEDIDCHMNLIKQYCRWEVGQCLDTFLRLIGLFENISLSHFLLSNSSDMSEESKKRYLDVCNKALYQLRDPYYNFVYNVIFRHQENVSLQQISEENDFDVDASDHRKRCRHLFQSSNDDHFSDINGDIIRKIFSFLTDSFNSSDD